MYTDWKKKTEVYSSLMAFYAYLNMVTNHICSPHPNYIHHYWN